VQFSITILQEPIDANDATRLKLASARKLFLQVREEAYRRTVASYEAFFEGRVDKAGVRALATLMMAAADGLFIAHEIDRDDVNFEAAFGLLAAALLGDPRQPSCQANSRRLGYQIIIWRLWLRN